ncbi:MAG: thermonuclease family protein [Candidatus Fervidibacter sp.]|uniref:thermonuclease family protein n=1 Tax=Candidatus Fervidibacter sp. TaxID=3100871 RepID=UPI00404AFB76
MKVFASRKRKRVKPLRSPFLILLLLLLAVPLYRHFNLKPTEKSLKVVKVVDGDTVVLSDGRTVRYIGIDAPERGQPFYEAAKNFNRKLVQGRAVELEFDVERFDRYGRLLAYVFVRNEEGRRIFVNAEMVRNGFALIYTKPPNVRHADLFLQLQNEARENKRGLWSVYRPESSPVIGNRKTLTFHKPTCPGVERISPQNIVKFSNAERALERGYHPCRLCQP